MKVERISFRCTPEQFQWINAQAIARCTPENMVKPIDVLRDLIDQAMKNSQSDQREAA